MKIYIFLFILISICLVLGIVAVLLIRWSNNKNKIPANNQQIKSSSTKYDDLERLQSLKESGAITEAEFETQKAKILK